MGMMPHELLELMWDALRSEHGILVRVSTEDYDTTRGKLYKIRRENPEMEILHLERSTDPNEIFITKRPYDEQ